MSMVEESSHQSDVIFTLTQNKISFTNNNVSNSKETPENTNSVENVEESESEQPDSVLCVLWKNGKLGAAYYKISDQQLYVFQEMIDLPPEFAVTRCLYREVNPHHTVTTGTACDNFVKCLISLASNENDDSTINSVQTITLPANLSLLHFKECSFEACEYKIYNIRLPSEPENATNAQREVFLHSLIDFDSKLSVHALGALIKFTEKNWAHLNSDGSELRFLHINQNSLSDRVFIDRNTFNGLQIFQTRSHDARFKHGSESSNREGHSIYRLLSEHCKSKLGFLCLRNILMNPTKDIEELNKRLDFIQFAMVPTNQGFIESLQDNIKKIYHVNTILRKIQYSRAKSLDWERLHNTIYHTLFLNELCGPYRVSSELLRWLDSTISTELYNLQHTINSALDLAQKFKRPRPIIRFGFDAELDAKELRKQDIAKNITAAAKFAVNQLPNFLNECSVVHMPEMGHLVAVKRWEANCDPNQLQDSGFQFIFEVNGLLHYKNAMCVELDKHLGNIHHEILAHENRIVQRLEYFVLRYNRDIRDPLKIIALIDCLISISRVVKEKGYIRPQFNQDNKHEIEGGRHPLLELISSDFVPNDYNSGRNYSHMKIITGPNDSGKSVYIKQIALIIFLAHIGSYVPAKKANIAMVHSIHSRIYATESAGVSLSAFMVDLTQMSKALHNAKSSSLVILDEFGRGTTGDDGTALLLGALKKFLNQEEFCPHVLVSTHLHQICHHLAESRLITHLKLDHTRCNAGSLVFLYKVVEGVSKSFGFEVAAAAGLDDDIIKRAKEIYAALYSGCRINPPQGSPRELDLSNVNIPELDD